MKPKNCAKKSAAAHTANAVSDIQRHPSQSSRRSLTVVPFRFSRSKLVISVLFIFVGVRLLGRVWLGLLHAVALRVLHLAIRLPLVRRLLHL